MQVNEYLRDAPRPPMTKCNIVKSGTVLIPSALTKRTHSSCTALPLPAAATTRTARCAPCNCHKIAADYRYLVPFMCKETHCVPAGADVVAGRGWAAAGLR